MIDATSREQLRQHAIAAWEHAKRLHADAADLISSSLDARRMHEERRARFVVERLMSGRAPEPKVAENESSLHSDSWAMLRVLTDQTIPKTDPVRTDLGPGRRGVGLVASSNLPTVVRLHTLATRRVGRVLGAQDAGTSLGLAIATQPDIAIIDTRLDLADGADLAFVIPTYAPRTRALVLTDDEDVAARAQSVGADALPRQFSDRALLAWLDKAVT